jgi:glycerophosphoryl diester phosphodiesterase
MKYLHSMKRLFQFVIFFLIFSEMEAQVYIPKFDLQGHRGARGLKPENTIPGFLLALDIGVTTLEMDLAVTKDRQLILSHEPWMAASICLKADNTPISSKEEKKLNIFRMTYDEVSRFDCGSRSNEKFPEQEKIKLSKPLLKDAILAIENHIKNYTQYEADYNIEIKCTPEGDNKSHPAPAEFSELVFNLIDEYLPWDRVLIQSFDFRVLRYWHEKHPEVRLAALIENNRSVHANLTELGFTPSVYSPYFKLINNDDIRYLKQKKIRIIPWTVNEIEDIKKIRGMGVDGLITDYPDRAAQLGLGIKRPKP